MKNIFKSFNCKHEVCTVIKKLVQEHGYVRNVTFKKCCRCGNKKQFPHSYKEGTLIANSEMLSDGYHTMSELYDHRSILYIALLKSMSVKCFKSQNNFENINQGDWFILYTTGEKQISYHLSIRLWGLCDFAETKQKVHQFDNHTSSDVLDRIKSLI